MSHGEHYFTASPASPAELRTIDVRLAGRDVRITTASGVFSGDHLDHATRLLLDVVPPPPATGDLLDLGCGWGPISLTLALRSPAATVWGVDVNRRALDLLGRNATRVGADNIRAVKPDGVPSDVMFSTIWSNPPIRVGKAVLHDMLLTWLPRLAPGGTAYLVVQKNLGADSLHAWLGGTLGTHFAVGRHATSKGFRVLAVHRHLTPPEETA